MIVSLKGIPSRPQCVVRLSRLYTIWSIHCATTEVFCSLAYRGGIWAVSTPVYAWVPQCTPGYYSRFNRKPTKMNLTPLTLSNHFLTSFIITHAIHSIPSPAHGVNSTQSRPLHVAEAQRTLIAAVAIAMTVGRSVLYSLPDWSCVGDFGDTGKVYSWRRVFGMWRIHGTFELYSARFTAGRFLKSRCAHSIISWRPSVHSFSKLCIPNAMSIYFK